MYLLPCISCSAQTDVALTCCAKSKKGICKACCLKHWRCPGCNDVDKFRVKLLAANRKLAPRPSASSLGCNAGMLSFVRVPSARSRSPAVTSASTSRTVTPSHTPLRVDLADDEDWETVVYSDEEADIAAGSDCEDGNPHFFDGHNAPPGPRTSILRGASLFLAMYFCRCHGQRSSVTPGSCDGQRSSVTPGS